MADTLERLSRDSKYWTPRFHYNFPNVNSMMQQSEITVGPNVIDQSDHSENFAPPPKQDNMVSEWNGHVQQHWKAWEYVESDPSTNETLSSTTCSKTCNKTCRSCLCVVLMLSFIIAVIAAIGLTIFLTQFGYKTTQSRGGNYSHGGTFKDVNLTEIQQSVLTRIFCGRLEDLLESTEFPVENGLQHCFAKIFHMETTGTIRIEMQATPVKGYTMIEKIKRALNKENVNRNEVLSSTTVKSDLSNESTVTPNVNNRSTYSDTNVITTETTSTVTGIISSTAFPFYDDLFSSTTADYTTNDASSHDRTEKSDTTTSKSLSSTSLQFASSTSKAQYSTPVEQSATVMTNTVPTSTEFGEVHVPSSTNKPTSYTKMMTATTRRVPENKLPVFKKPDRIELFKPSVDSNGFVIPSATISNSVPIRKAGGRSPQVVETLMTGGVIRLPLRTNSNFRFLFSSNSDASRNDGQSQVSNKDTAVKVAVRKPVDNQVQ